MNNWLTEVEKDIKVEDQESNFNNSNFTLPLPVFVDENSEKFSNLQEFYAAKKNEVKEKKFFLCKICNIKTFKKMGSNLKRHLEEIHKEIVSSDIGNYAIPITFEEFSKIKEQNSKR